MLFNYLTNQLISLTNSLNRSELNGNLKATFNNSQLIKQDAENICSTNWMKFILILNEIKSFLMPFIIISLLYWFRCSLLFYLRFRLSVLVRRIPTSLSVVPRQSLQLFAIHSRRLPPFQRHPKVRGHLWPYCRTVSPSSWDHGKQLNFAKTKRFPRRAVFWLKVEENENEI